MISPAGARIPLRAGPLEMVFNPAAGWLRHVRLNGRVVLAAVYPAVRDQFWNTLDNRLSNVAVEATADRFRLTFDAACRAGPIDFAFRGTVTGTPDGAVTYEFDGVARSAFLRNRIGLCALHPIDGCAGAACEVEHADGTREQARFPAEIAPHQPFRAVRAITHAAAPGVRLEVRFAGDVFETEDQRNWTDASFKTYPTPLALPVPVAVSPGDAVRQSVTLRLVGEPAVIDLGGTRGRLPALGFGCGDRDPDAREAELLRALRPAHLRVDLTPADADRLRAAAARAEAVGTALEVAVLLGDDPDADLRRLADAARAVRPRVGSWVVCRGRAGVAGAAELGLARRHLAALAPGARFGVGTNGYFTQWNRDRVDLGDAAFVAFSVNPQVHAFDDESVVETLAGQSAVLASARRLAGGRGVAVTPVTLRPRFNPGGGDAVPPDPRQGLPFTAAWALASVRRLAEAGAASATYFEATGPRGLIDGGHAFPVYRVFADLAGVAGWEVDAGVCSRPLEVEGMVFRAGRRWVALVANLTPRDQDVRLAFAGRRLRLAPYEVARVEGDSA